MQLASIAGWGVGYGWALQSAEWLVDETAVALTEGGDLDTALESYRRAHRRRLGPHHFVISDIASGRRANPLERALYRGAVDDDDVFHTFEAIGSRRRSPATLFAPRTLWQPAHSARPRAPTASPPRAARDRRHGQTPLTLRQAAYS